jgi:hypothetical protein
MATYVKIQTVTVGAGGSSSITFSSIPQTYTDLKVVVSSRSTHNNGQTWSDYEIRFNSSTSNRNDRFIYGNGASATFGTDASSIVARTSAAGQTTSVFGSTEFYIPNYTSSNNKSVSIDSVSENNNATSIQILTAGLWSNTAAITQIDLVCMFSSNFAEHTTATLYGIKSS